MRRLKSDGLPTPRMTATIYPPTMKHGLGKVIVHGAGGPPKPGRGPVDRADKTLTCSRCHAQGHARSNRLCPARSEA